MRCTSLLALYFPLERETDDMFFLYVKLNEPVIFLFPVR